MAPLHERRRPKADELRQVRRKRLEVGRDALEVRVPHEEVRRRAPRHLEAAAACSAAQDGDKNHVGGRRRVLKAETWTTLGREALRARTCISFLFFNKTVVCYLSITQGVKA